MAASSFLVVLMCLMSFMDLSLQQEQPTLLFVQHLARHGARYPIYNTNGEDGTAFAWKERDFGELTTPGKSMHYLLGQQLYKQYWQKLFSGTPYLTTYNQSKFYFKTTNMNRTIESLQSQLMGLLENLPFLKLEGTDMDYSYPPWTPKVTAEVGPVFVNATKFHPIAFHSQKDNMNPYDKGDFLRTYSPEICPNQNKWILQNWQSLRAKQILSDPNYLRQLANLQKAVGHQIGLQNVYKYYDNWICMKYLNSSAGLLYFRTLNAASQRTWQSMISLDLYLKMFNTPQQLSATATGYFNATINNIKSIIQDKSGVQWAIYSAHDTTIGNMLAALNLVNVECVYEAYVKNLTTSDTCLFKYPGFASTLLFEVYRYANLTHTIKIRFNGEYRKIPFCGYKLECNVDTFYQWYDSFKDEQYDKTCGVFDSHGDTWFTIAVLEFGVLMMGFIYVMVIWLEKNALPHVAPKEKEKPKMVQDDTETANAMIKESLMSQD